MPSSPIGSLCSSTTVPDHHGRPHPPRSYPNRFSSHLAGSMECQKVGSAKRAMLLLLHRTIACSCITLHALHALTACSYCIGAHQCCYGLFYLSNCHCSYTISGHMFPGVRFITASQLPVVQQAGISTPYETCQLEQTYDIHQLVLACVLLTHCLSVCYCCP